MPPATTPAAPDAATERLDEAVVGDALAQLGGALRHDHSGRHPEERVRRTAGEPRDEACPPGEGSPAYGGLARRSCGGDPLSR